MLTLCRRNDIIASSEAPVPQKPKPERKQSFDPAATAQLEKSLAHRPDKNALIERNILKGMSLTIGMMWYLGLRGRRADDSVAPALQAAKEKLQRSQLEDKLEHALQARPKPEELVKEGILKEDEIPPV
ncbi:hypothetical protein C8Q74DRAFT_718925 [Fomes fomentarius]|nr:hypothetical protein C8Q74DRAFT_718925 [Fomes fomentarius]